MNESRLKHTIEAICTGTARPFNGAELSAIAKYPREGVVQLLQDGFAPDEQADPRYHGGPEKAVHLYPFDHHAFWQEELGDHPLLTEPGAFGSNLMVRGIREDDVHIGDRFRLGSALIEINQPRQPCWKVDHRFERKGVTATMLKTGRAGWYYRVIETGEVEAGDTMERVEIGHAEWNVTRTFAAVMRGEASEEEFHELSQLAKLSPNWRERAARRLK